MYDIACVLARGVSKMCEIVFVHSPFMACYTYSIYITLTKHDFLP